MKKNLTKVLLPSHLQSSLLIMKKPVEICHENSYGSDFNLKCGEIAELSNAENSGCQADNT